MYETKSSRNTHRVMGRRHSIISVKTIDNKRFRIMLQRIQKTNAIHIIIFINMPRGLGDFVKQLKSIKDRLDVHSESMDEVQNNSMTVPPCDIT